MPTIRPRLLAVLAVLAALAVGVLSLPLAPAQPKKDKGNEPKPDAKLAEKLAAVREAHKVPAVFAAVVEGDKLVAFAAVGVRKAGEAEPVTADDLIHIGSNTKAMTATVLALLIEKGKLKWNSTIGQTLPGLKGKIHADYLDVTVAQLLAHEGAVGQALDLDWRDDPNQTARARRAAMIPDILKSAPAHKPGTKFLYSNASYVVAAALAEGAADKSWEELMTTTLFRPLGMNRAGFGPPGKKDALEQPWGHKLVAGKLDPTQLDNSAVLGPSGSVHAPLADWAKFAALHLQGARGKGKLLKPESFARLHTPTPGFSYAGGWLVGKDGSLGHDGSNTFWYARIRIQPKQNLAVLTATNLGGDEGRKAVDDIERATNDYYRTRFGK